MQMARTELEVAFAAVTPDDWARHVPYGSRTLHDLLAHVAAADQVWAQTAQGLLKGEAEVRAPLTPAEAQEARTRAIERGRRREPQELLDEMGRRRKLLLSLYELLEPRHLALALRSFGEQHNSVRERIWLGYHDRLHAADVGRALRMQWHPAPMTLLPALEPVVQALSPDAALYVIHNVDPVYWERPSPLPGWSYRQLLTHIATGDWMFQTHLRSVIEHHRAADWPDVGAGNAKRLAERGHSTERALIEEYLSMRHESVLLMSQLKPADLDLAFVFIWETPPATRTVLDYLNWFEWHDRTHREQLRPAMRYVRALGG